MPKMQLITDIIFDKKVIDRRFMAARVVTFDIIS